MTTLASLRRRAATHRLGTYIALTFLVTWGFWGGVVLFEPSATTLLQLVGGFGPLIAAAITAWIAGDVRPWAAQLVRWRVPVRWWAYAVLVPGGIVGLVVVGSVGFGGGIDVSRLPGAGSIVAIGVLTFLRGGLEEPGWRGMALPLLQKRFNATVASGVLGVVWTTWHLPLFVTQGTNQAGSSLVLYGMSVLPLTVLLTVLYNNTRGSVLLAMLFHTTWNAIQGVVGPAITGAGRVSPNVLVLVVLWIAALGAIAIHGVSDLSGERLMEIPRPTR
ncbi:CPBP family intramembrane glutamic endopeptidase [Halobaculum marinum]|uniref:CPBP family intramembrane glutamic endopeptidase n=1 Tax=Halobaculum marinum TaxID=3031996 RepID=A0ABD5X5Z3_9EURY|nr:CPBP family intramembrane glutamic endopeptidase [Halobaculum sp. DT55]